MVSKSRARFPASLSAHQSLLFLGFTPRVGQACQKQPSTKTATLLRGKAMSMVLRGIPGTGYATRKRYPRAWSRLRRTTSGLVSWRF